MFENPFGRARDLFDNGDMTIGNKFDFADSTRQVCTELIYRGIQGKGGITLDLAVRAGHETLSADDIALYYLNRHPGAFQFLLYAEQDRTGRITKRSSSTARAASSA